MGFEQGREDDNKETMQKRLKVFADYSVPVVKYYEATGKVRKVFCHPILNVTMKYLNLENLVFDINLRNVFVILSL